MTTRKLVVVSAGLSQPSSTRLLADRLLEATQRRLQEDGVSTDTQTIEVRQHAGDIANNLVAGFASPSLTSALEQVAAADGVIAVTPIFSGSYSGLFKSFFDVLDPEALVDTPVLLAATAGTARHSLALEHAMRPLFSYLKAVVVPTAVFAASEDWGAGSGASDQLVQRIDRAAAQLARLVSQTQRGGPVDSFVSPTPFEELLARSSS